MGLGSSTKAAVIRRGLQETLDYCHLIAGDEFQVLMIKKYRDRERMRYRDRERMRDRDRENEIEGQRELEKDQDREKGR